PATFVATLVFSPHLSASGLLYFCLCFFYCHGTPRDLHSFPTRRSSDLRLVLAAAEGYPDLEIASHHEVNRHTVALWRERVQAKGIGSVWEIQAGRGRKPKYELEKRDALIRATLETKPKGMTHWSCRTMAKAQGVSKSTVNRLWQL